MGCMHITRKAEKLPEKKMAMCCMFKSTLVYLYIVGRHTRTPAIVSSLLPPHGSQGSKSGEFWQQVSYLLDHLTSLKTVSKAKFLSEMNLTKTH